MQVPLGCLLAWSRATAFPRSSPWLWQGLLLTFCRVFGWGLVDGIQAGVQPQDICYFFGRESIYRPVEADQVPCQGIACLPSGNASGIASTILSYKMKTKTVCIAKENIEKKRK